MINRTLKVQDELSSIKEFLSPAPAELLDVIRYGDIFCGVTLNNLYDIREKVEYTLERLEEIIRKIDFIERKAYETSARLRYGSDDRRTYSFGFY